MVSLASQGLNQRIASAGRRSNWQTHHLFRRMPSISRKEKKKVISTGGREKPNGTRDKKGNTIRSEPGGIWQIILKSLSIRRHLVDHHHQLQQASQLRTTLSMPIEKPPRTVNDSLCTVTFKGEGACAEKKVRPKVSPIRATFLGHVAGTNWASSSPNTKVLSLLGRKEGT